MFCTDSLINPLSAEEPYMVDERIKCQQQKNHMWFCLISLFPLYFSVKKSPHALDIYIFADTNETESNCALSETTEKLI